METKWFTIGMYCDPIKTTNVPYECLFKRGVEPIGGNFAVPYCIGSQDWAGTAHYRERVGPEHGSGMYFNAFRNMALSAGQQIRDLGGGNYACISGNFFLTSERLVRFALMDGAHIFYGGLGIKWWDGNLLHLNVDWGINCTYACADAISDVQGAYLQKGTRTIYPEEPPAMAPKDVGAWVFSKWVAAGRLSSQWVVQDWSKFYLQDYAPVPLPQDLESTRFFDWKDKEYWAFQWIKEVGVVLPPYGSMVSQAYTEAIATFPSVQSNTLANILELIELARSILSGDLGRTLKETKNAKAMKDAWLAYRYSYTTSKLDLAELKSFVRRVGSLPVGEITLRSKITFSHTTVRCSVVLPMSDITGRLEGIESLGLKLSAANVWDLIPYSFVVDWFLRISDWLNYFETQGFALTLHPKQVWYSITTVYEGQTTYFRWSGSPALGLPFDLYAPVSKKTIAMRIGDAIALS